MRLVRPRRGSGLLARFAVISAVLTAVVGLVLSHVLSASIVQRATQSAEWTVVVAVRMGIEPRLTVQDLENGFDPRRLVPVTKAVAAAAADLQDGGFQGAQLSGVKLKIFNRSAELVFADDRSLIGRRSLGGDVERALEGEIVSAFSEDFADAVDADSPEREFVEIYVPVQYPGSSTPDGVIEVYLPYAPIAAQIQEDLHTLTVSLAVSLAVFYGVLFKFMAGVSRRMRRQNQALQISADRNHHQATHDALTELPNRVLLRDRTDQALTAAARCAHEVAVLLIDLDRFKEINDTLGHSYGDDLLRLVGPRLRSAMRDGDTVARLGGDEFAVLLPAVDGEAEARRIAERLREALHQRFEVNGVALDVEASIGIALSPWHGTDTEELLRNADIAMYVAKEEKAGAVVFAPDEHVTAYSRLGVLGDLRHALEVEDQLFLHYQPKFTLVGERIEGSEALLRWQHPTRGLVPPADFIPVAEGAGIILRLTERVLGMALTQMRQWQDAGLAVPVAVNLSTRCLLDASLPEMVQRLLTEHGVPARLLRLEVTESAVMGDAARCMQVLQRLHDLGVRLSLDDFGTGYSSMAYLRRLPVDELKIDRSFVLGMTTTAHDAVLVRTAIDLGHNLGLTVVAEGVEGFEHVTALRELGCDVAQGYHYARPMADVELTALLARVGTMHGTGAPIRH